MAAAVGRFDRRLDPDARRQSHTGFDLREQHVDERDVSGRSGFRDHDQVEPIACRLDDLDEIAVSK